MDGSNSKIPYIVTPRLRKNRRVENRWGLQYEISIQYTAFGRQCVPYMPAESPASLSEEIVESEPLYVCEQCKDCFRFQSSLEDHNKRRSWIFGIWCHSCFRTVCSHIPEIGSVCSICMGKDNEKRVYLRSRGFSYLRFQKWGAVKVFYNQCQLLEHMKLHGLCSINVSDIMLMPLPTDLNYNDWTLELEIACEALMEYTFLSRVHVMDWLRMNKMENNWWKLVDNDTDDDNILSKIVRGYKGRQLFKTLGKSEEDQDLNSDVSNVNKNSLHMEFIDANFKDQDKNNYSANTISDKNMSENEDNPCMPTDIAFVDCGPISKCFEPEPSVSYVLGKQISILKRSRQDIPNMDLTDKIAKTNCKRRKTVLNDLCLLEIDKNMTKVDEKVLNKNTVSKQSLKGSSQQYRTEQSFVKKTVGKSISEPIIETDIAKILNNPVKIDTPFSAKSIKLHKANSDHLEHDLQTSVETCDSKTLTTQSSKKADTTSIISDQLISNNKTIPEQNSQRFITFCNNDMITMEKKSNKTLSNSSINVNTSPQKKQVAGKYLIKNGKKYLIKESIKKSLGYSSNLLIATNVSEATKQLIVKPNISTLTTANSGEVENMEQPALPHNDISFLTPSPSPSELSSSSSCESHVKQTLKGKLRKVPPRLISLNEDSYEKISLVKEEHGEDLYMNIEIINHVPKDSRDMSKEIPKYRQKMIDEFYHMNKSDLIERINHLQLLSEEMKKALTFLSNNLVKDKLKSIKTLLLILEDCILICNKMLQDKKSDDVILDEWKKMNLNQRCPSCGKHMKPKSYMVGFSKLAKDDDIYCYCYKYVCHECLSYHGTSSRFIAHQNFHKKVEPHVCPDCRYSFVDAKFLEIHMWTSCFHMLKKRVFACKICEIDGFRDIESITRHFVIMHSVTKIACEVCHLIFPTYGEYVKHYTRIHTNTSKPKPVRLVMCKLGNEFIRCENFISYLYKCPAIQEIIWYKCPFCPLVTLENKHVTMIFSDHLRDKHAKRLPEIVSKEALPIVIQKKFERTSTPKGMLHTFVNAPCEDGTIIPKIVNTRTISSEIFERGSHDTDDIWPTNSDGSASTFALDTNSQVTRKVDLLPKILDVSSVADLKATASQSASQSEVIKTMSEEEDLSSKGNSSAKKTTVDDIKSDIREKESKKLEQLGKSNNESIISLANETEKFVQIDDVRTNLSTESSRKISNSESVSKTSTNGRIKVIDIRKICKPNIEPFIDESKSENENAANIIPKPPPLARIPQHILEHKGTEKACEPRNIAKPTSFSRRVTRKGRRIAICESTDTQEGCVEFLCHICNERISTSWPVVQAHYVENHSHEYQLATLTLRLKRLPTDYRRYYKKLLNNRKRKSDVTLSTAKKKRRWTPKKHTEAKDMSPLEVGLCVQEETAEDGEGNFKCKRCGQRCTDMSDLREHISANHRLKGRYLICLECGENFVVAPSLQMHLKAFHGIEDPISHMDKNPSYAPDVFNDLVAEGKTTVANQCYVCMAVFEDKAAVDKHLRVHGMAFLNRKRIEARNALKSPEKKPNMEENKGSPVTESPKEAVRRDKPVETILEKLNAAI